MQHLRRHHHAFVRFALVAMLALACVPTLSRWLVTAPGPLAWAEVCTPQGMKRLSDAAGAATHAATHLDACGYCTLAAGGLPAGGEAGWRAEACREALPWPSLPAVATLAWTAAQPRAPPALS